MVNKHTGTPWEIGDYYKSILNKDKSVIAMILGDGLPRLTDKRKANAEFIVRAVNNHKSLIATCSELLEYLSFAIDNAECDDERETMQAIYDDACELLTKVEANDV